MTHFAWNHFDRMKFRKSTCTRATQHVETSFARTAQIPERIGSRGMHAPRPDGCCLAPHDLQTSLSPLIRAANFLSLSRRAVKSARTAVKEEKTCNAKFLLQTALSNLEEMQHNSMYRTDNRSRSMVGPMRSRPMEKRHDTSPYSGVPYLSPPPPDTWRRTNSDSALHQSANEACQSTSAIPHRRGSYATFGFSPFFRFLRVNLFRSGVERARARARARLRPDPRFSSRRRTLRENVTKNLAYLLFVYFLDSIRDSLLA